MLLCFFAASDTRRIPARQDRVKNRQYVNCSEAGCRQNMSYEAFPSLPMLPMSCVEGRNKFLGCCECKASCTKEGDEASLRAQPRQVSFSKTYCRSPSKRCRKRNITARIKKRANLPTSTCSTCAEIPSVQDLSCRCIFVLCGSHRQFRLGVESDRRRYHNCHACQ